jgi:hypothetical protein
MASKPKNPTPPTTRPAAPRTTTPADAADRARLNSTKSPARPMPTDEQIRSRAYFLWTEAGCPSGDGVQFWLDAERELTAPR